MDPRPAYDEAATPQQMARDGRVTERRLHLLEQAARRATRPAPRLAYDAFPRELPKPRISVDAAAVRLASLYCD